VRGATLEAGWLTSFDAARRVLRNTLRSPGLGPATATMGSGWATAWCYQAASLDAVEPIEGRVSDGARQRPGQCHTIGARDCNPLVRWRREAVWLPGLACWRRSSA
jgi:hypothetical protein